MVVILPCDRFEDQTEPVFLDIHSEDGATISQMKVPAAGQSTH